MRRTHIILPLMVVLLGMAGVASATQFTIQNLKIQYFPGPDPSDNLGLMLTVTQSIALPYSFELTDTGNDDHKHLASLAKIITTEQGMNYYDKNINQPFVVSFDFVAPEPESVIFYTNSHGSGSTKIVVEKSDKVQFEFGFGGLLEMYIPKYEANWKNPGTERLRIEFKLIHDSDPPPAVPEPATMFLLGSGLIGLAAFARRKFRK